MDRQLPNTKLIDGKWLTLEETFEKHHGLIGHFSKSFIGRGKAHGLTPDDLYNIGYFGFVKAYRDFDTSYGFRFSTYLAPKVKGEIRRYFRDNTLPLKYSRRVYELASRFRKYDVLPSGEALAKEFKQPLDIIEEAIHLFNNNSSISKYSLDVTIKSDKDSESYYNYVPQIEDDSSVIVNEFLQSLPEKFQVVVKGLMAGESQKEIGRKIGCSQMHVSRHLKQIRKLYLQWDAS